MPSNNIIQIRRGSESLWNSTNPILASGEFGLDDTNNIIKVGDGTTNWNNLKKIVDITGNPNVSGLLSATSGNFTNSLTFNNILVSVSGHNHVTNDITNFNSSVSGLLPVKNISSGSGIGIVSNSGDYTISVTGTFGLTGEEVDDRVNSLLVAGSYVNLNYDDNLNNLTVSVTGVQPSGNYSVVGHNHISSDITDFNSSVSGLLPVKNIVPGTSVNISSVSGEYTISVTGVAASSASSLITTCHNLTGSTINKMSAVYINGGHGNLPSITLAIASGESTSSKTFGLTMEDINNNSSGDVVVVGSLIDVNTNQFGAVEGTTLYLSPTVSGGLTTTKPSAPNHLVSLGKIVRNHNIQGIIQVSVQNGFELNELHNVAVNGTSNGQFLQYNSSNSLWVASDSGNFSSLSVNGTGVSLAGHTHTSSNITDFSSSVSGLLPVTNIVGGTNISVIASGSIYTVSVSGSLGLTTEEVDDRVSNLLVAGSGISLSYNDNANSLTISTVKNIILSDVVGSTNYIGSAPNGSSTSSNVWTIKRTIYTSGGSVSSSGTATSVAWDNRTSVIYT